MSQNAEDPSPLANVEELAQLLQKEGIAEDVAKRFAEIADRQYSAERPDAAMIAKEVDRAVSRLSKDLLAKLDESQKSKLKGYIEEFIVNFIAGGAFFLVQDYIAIVKQYFMSADEKIETDKSTTAEMYLIHREKLERDEKLFLSSNMESLEKVRELFRSGLIKAMEESGTVPNAKMLSLLAGPLLEQGLIVEPLRARLAAKQG